MPSSGLVTTARFVVTLDVPDHVLDVTGGCFAELTETGEHLEGEPRFLATDGGRRDDRTRVPVAGVYE